MARVLNGFVHQDQIASGIRRAERGLKPDVVRIRFSLEDDWTGDPSVFFKIVLSDAASRKRNLSGLTERIITAIRNEVNADELGLHDYFNFRSLSEQNELNEAAWS